jgi:hypothetical protein
MGESYDHRPDATGETDALCKNVSAIRTRSFLPRTCTPVAVSKKDPLDTALGKLYKDKILLAGGSREETESL